MNYLVHFFVHIRPSIHFINVVVLPVDPRELLVIYEDTTRGLKNGRGIYRVVVREADKN